jgi:DNA-binding NtrC family response regulator
MAALYEQMEPLAASGLPVLIAGETGVGKELVARCLHLSSPRREAPFVAINCAAVPGDLLEAELFGIGRAVATGVAPRPGKLASADGGTLFLDEIGEMPPPFQAKLLRALQEKEIQPLGGASKKIDPRVLAATNADVGAGMETGAFRRDLYYRLAGAVVRVPPLRERREDVPALAGHFLRRWAAEAAKPVPGFTEAALEALRAYPWPGNVRELEHEIRRLVCFCPPGQAIDLPLLSPQIRRSNGSPPESPTGPGAPLPTLDLAELEHRALREAMRRTRGCQTQAARLLGISRFALRRRLERHGV